MITITLRVEKHRRLFKKLIRGSYSPLAMYWTEDWNDGIVVLRPDIAHRLNGEYDLKIESKDNHIRGNDIINVEFMEDGDAIMFRMCYTEMGL